MKKIVCIILEAEGGARVRIPIPGRGFFLHPGGVLRTIQFGSIPTDDLLRNFKESQDKLEKIDEAGAQSSEVPNA